MNLKKLQTQQNCALRAVRRVNNYYPSEQLRIDLHLDSIETMMYKSTCKFAYKCFYNMCPNVLNGMLVLYVSERELRSNDELNAIVPRCRTQWAERNFAYRAVIHWNLLPLDLKTAPSIESFKSRLRKLDCTTVMIS